jgi:hypothetical protein
MSVKHSFFCLLSSLKLLIMLVYLTVRVQTSWGVLWRSVVQRTTEGVHTQEYLTKFLNRSILRSQKRRCILRSHKVKRERTRCSRKPNVSPDLVSTYLFKLVFDSSLRPEPSQKPQSGPPAVVAIMAVWTQSVAKNARPYLGWACVWLLHGPKRASSC